MFLCKKKKKFGGGIKSLVSLLQLLLSHRVLEWVPITSSKSDIYTLLASIQKIWVKATAPTQALAKQGLEKTVLRKSLRWGLSILWKTEPYLCIRVLSQLPRAILQELTQCTSIKMLIWTSVPVLELNFQRVDYVSLCGLKKLLISHYLIYWTYFGPYNFSISHY